MNVYKGSRKKVLFLVARPLGGGVEWGKGLATKKIITFFSSLKFFKKTQQKNVATKLVEGGA